MYMYHVGMEDMSSDPDHDISYSITAHDMCVYID